MLTITRNAEGLPAELRKAIFATAAPAAGKTAPGTATLSNGSAVLYVVNAVRPGSLESPEQAAQLPQLSQQLAGQVALAEFASYVREIERNAKVTRNAKAFE